jgi:hypothetical protein
VHAEFFYLFGLLVACCQALQSSAAEQLWSLVLKGLRLQLCQQHQHPTSGNANELETKIQQHVEQG